VTRIVFTLVLSRTTLQFMAIAIAPLSRTELPQARSLLERACRSESAAAVTEEKLFGPAPNAASYPLAAHVDGGLVGLAVTSARWLRLLAVALDCRNRGIGTALLGAAEAALRDRGQSESRTMDQPGNYLEPGIDMRDEATVSWFQRRGYVRVATHTSLEVALVDNPRVTAAQAERSAAAGRAAGYVFRRACSEDEPSLVAWLEREFSTGWGFEVARALATTPSSVHVALAQDGSYAAFAAHDGNNSGLGGFGPGGTAPPHRGHGLGTALLLACLSDVAAAGHERCLVPWIGPREFYQRTVGVVAEHRYVVMSRSL
jgi:GNAT superfamily N-acetyltransferase